MIIKCDCCGKEIKESIKVTTFSEIEGYEIDLDICDVCETLL